MAASARAGWLDVYERLGQISETELPTVSMFRHGIAHTIGLVEARMGLASATEWAELPWSQSWDPVMGTDTEGPGRSPPSR